MALLHNREIVKFGKRDHNTASRKKLALVAKRFKSLNSEEKVTPHTVSLRESALLADSPPSITMKEICFIRD